MTIISEILVGEESTYWWRFCVWRDDLTVNHVTNYNGPLSVLIRKVPF